MSIKLTVEKEAAIRQRIFTEVSEVEDVGISIGEVKNFSGIEHFASWIGLTNQDADSDEVKAGKIDNLLVKYAMIYCVNLLNSNVIGAAHCPDKFLDYNIELFQQNDLKNDEVSSHNDFIATVINLDFAFLTGQDYSGQGIPNVKRSQLQSLQPFSTSIMSNRVPGVVGHFGLFRVRVEAK